MFKGRPRRALTAILVLLWITAYLILAWYVGASYIPERWIWQVLYFPIAGLLWVPVAIYIMHKMAEKPEPIN